MRGIRVKEARIILSARWNFRLFFIGRLTALECSCDEIEIRPIVRKDLKAGWPWADM
jgi:hypothetical protein